MDYREIELQQLAKAKEEREARAVAHAAFVEKLETREDGSVDCRGDGSFACTKFPIAAPAAAAKQCVPGDLAGVHYTGWLFPAPDDGSAPALDAASVEKVTAGKPFDSSRGKGREFAFRVGSRMVIPGWDTGVATMKVGERAFLLLAPDEGYGANGAGSVIPPGAWLLFDVELVVVQEKPVACSNEFTTPSLIAGIIVVIICAYYMFFKDFGPSPASDAAEL